MADIAHRDVIEYFKNRKQRFINSKGMELGLTAKMELWSCFSLRTHDDGPLAIDISTEDDNAAQFIEGFKLNTIREINDLGYVNAWIRYLNGEAEISVTPFELEAPLSFRIFKSKTIIYSLELHFYDEAYEHLTMREDFEKYISANQNRLQLAGENRHR